ncbi:MAG: hypothetical protein GYB64_04045 [Chloroflexi bacterium]|nr:hypothetical protein [Chloroflexota bacterium]
MFRNKAKSDIRITIKNGRTIDGLQAFLPNEEVRGEAEIIPENDITVDAIRARLVWYTQGRGDRDMGVVDTVTGPSGFLTGGVPVRMDFTLRLPSAPWSYAGQLITLVWAVQIVVDRDRGLDYDDDQPIIMTPTFETLDPFGS